MPASSDDLPPEVQSLITTVQDAFDGFEPGGIAVDEVDGKWYVSPIGTWFDFVNEALGALDSQELQDIIDAARGLEASVACRARQRRRRQRHHGGHRRHGPGHGGHRPGHGGHRRHGAVTVAETFPQITDGAAHADEFKSADRGVHRGLGDCADSVGFTLTGAECETPDSVAVGTTYTCWATTTAARSSSSGWRSPRSTASRCRASIPPDRRGRPDPPSARSRQSMSTWIGTLTTTVCGR